MRWPYRLVIVFVTALAAASTFAEAADSPATSPADVSSRSVIYERITLPDGPPLATLCILRRTGVVPRHPVILMLGNLKADEPPPWSTDLIDEGYMLVAFTVEYPPPPGRNTPRRSAREHRQTQINAAEHKDTVGAE